MPRLERHAERELEDRAKAARDVASGWMVTPTGQPLATLAEVERYARRLAALVRFARYHGLPDETLVQVLPDVSAGGLSARHDRRNQ